MIIFLECGRLGNQIIQINALKYHFSGHKIVCIGCSDAYNYARWSDVVFIVSRRLEKFCWFFKNHFPLYPIFGTIKEYTIENKYFLKVRSGVIPNLYFLYPSYFQNVDAALYLSQSNFRVYERHGKSANDWLSSHNLLGLTNLVFFHVRRGDYLKHPSPSSPAVLDLMWYKNAMTLMRDYVSNPVFIVISDDTYYCDDVFGADSSCFISRNSKYTDLALMSRCNHGILSASSLAFVGACYLRHNCNSSDSSLFLAPRDWLGYRRGDFYPPTFKFPWIKYI